MEVVMEPGAACCSRTKLGCSAARLSRAAGCELGEEYPEQSGAVIASFHLMTDAL